MNLLLVVLTVALAVVCLVLFIERGKSRRVVSQLRTEQQALRAENEALGVFRAIRDAEFEAQRIRREAQAQADVILAGAQQAREKTESDIKAQLAVTDHLSTTFGNAKQALAAGKIPFQRRERVTLLEKSVEIVGTIQVSECFDEARTPEFGKSLRIVE